MQQMTDDFAVAKFIDDVSENISPDQRGNYSLLDFICILHFYDGHGQGDIETNPPPKNKIPVRLEFQMLGQD